MRKRNFYEMPPNGNKFFRRKEQMLFFKEIYETFAEPVCQMKYLDYPWMAQNPARRAYFKDAIWVLEKMGLKDLGLIKQDYSVNCIQQFYATVVFGSEVNIPMTWQSGEYTLQSDFCEFAKLLGYPFRGLDEPCGVRLHENTNEYNKAKLAPIFITETTKGMNNLYPLYNILIRMFRSNISPSAGNEDAVRGALVNLMAHAHHVYRLGPEDERNQHVDVMYYIFQEMHIAITEKKCPPYAPYIMKLILEATKRKIKCDTKHPAGHYQLKKTNASTSAPPTDLRGSSRARVPYDTDEDVDMEEMPPARTKHAMNSKEHVKVQTKKLNWWQTHVLCMKVDLHDEQYEQYKRLHYIKKQNKRIISKLSKDAQGNDAPMSEDSKTISYGKWRHHNVKWSDFAEVSSALRPSDGASGSGTGQHDGDEEMHDGEDAE